LIQVEEYDPKNSLVIGPYKMKRFFEQMKSPDDSLPWKGMYSQVSDLNFTDDLR
jgi:hypothetical protein